MKLTVDIRYFVCETKPTLVAIIYAFLHLLLFDLTYQLEIPNQITVGKVCSSNATCTGINEYCQTDSWMSPSCSVGRCRCLPCHTSGSEPNRGKTCVRIVAVSLGDVCSETYFEVVTTVNAECRAGRVRCLEGFAESSDNKKDCVRPNSGEGDKCKTADDCDGDLWCGPNNRCQCIGANEKYDSLTGKCIPRQTGDSCRADVDCIIDEAGLWNRNAVECRGGTCACNTNTGAVAVTETTMDQTSGHLRNRSICLLSSSAEITFSAKGDECTPLDSLSNSSSHLFKVQIKLCSKGLTCSSCPGEPEQVARCRLATESRQAPVCYLFSRELTKPAENIDLTRRSLCPNGCQDNEVCVVGYCGPQCRCKEGFVRNSLNHTCSLLLNLKPGDRCNLEQSYGVEQLPLHSLCKSSKVVCRSPFYARGWGNQCLKVRPGSVYGTSCHPVVKPCPNNNEALWCKPSEKICRCFESEAMKWNDELDRCERREFDDDCLSDEQCATFGSVASGGFTYGGGICWAGKCSCSRRFIATNFTYFVDTPLTGTTLIKTKVICIHRSSQLNVPIGQPCTLDPIFFGDNPQGKTRVCQSGTLCVRCENDPAKNAQLLSTQGFCTNILP